MNWISAGANASLELRNALRALLSSSSTTVVSAAVLLVAMSAATVAFSVVDAVAIRQLPFGNPDELVGLSLRGPIVGRPLPATPSAFANWSESSSSFSGIGAASPAGTFRIGTGEEARVLTAWSATPTLFEVLQVRPALGRTFSHSSTGGAESEAIITHRAWHQHFGATPAVIGAELHSEGRVWRVVGVLPPETRFPISAGFDPEVYVHRSLTAGDRENDRAFTMFVVARLHGGVSLEQATAEVDRLGGVVLTPLHDQVVGSARAWLMMALGASVLLLAMACVNVTGLQLARAIVRLPDLAIREALGATRLRIYRAVLFEGVLLALLVSSISVAMSYVGIDAVKRVLPETLTRVQDIAINSRVMAGSLAAALACGLVTASAPVLLIGRSLASAIRDDAGPVVSGRTQQRFLGAVLGLQIGVLASLLVVMVLVGVSFIEVLVADLGFDRTNIARVDFRGDVDGVELAQRPAAISTLRRELISHVEAVEGVEGVGLLIGATPLSGGAGHQSIVIPGWGETKGDERPERRTVDGAYFNVAGIRVLQGRIFGRDDRFGSPPVMVINRRASELFFNGRDVIGRVVFAPAATQIVGVVEDVRSFGIEEIVKPQIYLAADQHPTTSSDGKTFGGLLIKTRPQPMNVEPAIRRAVRATTGIEPGAMLVVSDYFDRLTERRRFTAQVMVWFGGVALIVAGMGVYGTMTFLVQRNARGIALRLALGASRAHVAGWVIKKTAYYVLPGLLIGLGVAWSGSGLLAAVVFGIEATNPVVYLAVALLIAGLSLLGSLHPATRAMAVSPVALLKGE